MPIIVINGDIDWDVVRRIEAADPGPVTVLIQSCGGNPQAALAASAALRARGANTVARANAFCNSAAIAVYAAARKRIATSSTQLAHHLCSPCDPQMDSRFRQAISLYAGIPVDVLADLERRNVTMFGIAGLQCGLVTDLVDCPALTARAHQRRRAVTAHRSHTDQYIRAEKIRVAALGRSDPDMSPRLQAKLIGLIDAGRVKPGMVFGLPRQTLAAMVERLPAPPRTGWGSK